MSIVLAILSLLTALLPLADKGIQSYQNYRQVRQVQPAQALTALKPVLPPDVGQPNVVFYRGEWWKYENGTWLVWRQHGNHVAQGGTNSVIR